MRPLELSWVPSSGFQQQNSQSNPKNAFNKINIYSDFIKVLIFLSKLYHFVGNQLLFMLHLKLSSCHRCLLLPHNAVSLGKLMLVQRRTLPELSYFGRIFSHLILEFLKLRVANFKASYRGIIGITKSRTFLPFILSNGVVIRLSLWKQNNLRNKIRWIIALNNLLGVLSKIADRGAASTFQTKQAVPMQKLHLRHWNFFLIRTKHIKVNFLSATFFKLIKYLLEKSFFPKRLSKKNYHYQKVHSCFSSNIYNV